MKPIIKWAGSKQFSAPEIMKVIPEFFSWYHEPFFGGGALFYELRKLRPLMWATLSDINEELIVTHRAIRALLPAVLRCIEELKPLEVTAETYYRIRASKPQSQAEIAARFLYLNKTCYNGLYRANKNGEFNVPWGKKDKWIVDTENLIAVCRSFDQTYLCTQHFTEALNSVKKGEVVYLDPPYFPVSKTASFVGYSKDGFTYEDQVKVASEFARLANMGVCVIASNADLDIVRKLYGDVKGVQMKTLMVPRNINSKGAGRAPVPELLIWANGRI
jgi:DNA adenine methylase